MNLRNTFSILLLILLPRVAISQSHVGLPDSVIFGNLDGSIIEVVPGLQFSLPVWVKTDDSVSFIQSYPATNDSFIVSRDGGIVFSPLVQWDQADFLQSEHTVRPDRTLQALLCYLDQPHDSPYILHTNYQWVHIADYFMTATDDSGLLGITSCIEELTDPSMQYTWFGMSDGYSGEYPDLVFGCFRLTATPNIPGDTNGDCLVNGIDVMYLVNYLKGIGSPPIWGGCQ